MTHAEQHAQQDMLQLAMDSLTRQVVEGLTKNLSVALEQELTRSLSQSLVESEFYRRLSRDMRSGLQEIYQEISRATRPESHTEGEPVQQAEQLFMEASRQLDDILQTTEQATEEIMDVVEKHMALQEEAKAMLAKLRKTRKANDDILKLIEINNELGDNLIKIMTSLSFQDLTGQRIKRIISALKRIEATTFDLYVSTGLSIKAREEAPSKDLETIAQESKAKTTQLKGPQLDASQNDVDDLLKQLGL
ncbi:protein phosphatase CheZ [Megalodesulfovibrio gigas]|uniref:Putative chemotaxis protein n=1 Tax=Megalodesulfovibrio gigas (strain ATCC 19364 / DSM 1382 / NCIMB 9332 / VKM B-1759) TaxID=1121448 RepID=T2GD51_MEGG1|nr:protein phosphatase CheZ [Megalodesulfovibrio gigas]AGW14510.1 putative chemotaxis protein [Megalodesulfovibrio gigas DSM 1382 = ATCC 19364]